MTGSRVSDEVKYAVITLREEGYSYADIAKRKKIAKSSVYRICKRWEELHTIECKYQPGRKSFATPRDERQLFRLVREKRTSSSAALAQQWKNSKGQLASARTVRRILQKHNYMWRSACKKPRLNSAQKKKRLEFCNKYIKWSESMWHDVIFSDEMNIEVDSRKGRVMLRRKPEERMNESCLLKRTKQGSGSIGIWACINYQGAGFFHIFDGRLNSQSYCEILGEKLLPSIDLFQREGHQLIFQQDNAPCHSAKIVQDWFEENQIITLKWPPNSPDLNCIENLWSWLDTELGKKVIENVEQLRDEVTSLLSNVPVHICENLIKSMPKRLYECKRAKGGSTRY